MDRDGLRQLLLCGAGQADLKHIAIDSGAVGSKVFRLEHGSVGRQAA